MPVRRLLPDPAEDVDLVSAYLYPADRAWLRANMISSADGAATIEGRAGGLGNKTDQQVLGALRGLADVVIAGAGTVTAEGYGPARARPEYQEMRAADGQPAAPYMAVVSQRLQLDFESRYFVEATQQPIVVTCSAAPPDRLLAAEKVASVVIAGELMVSPALMVEALIQLGYRRLLCEGGPTLLAMVAADGVLDELCLTIAPLIVGGPSRRVLDGPLLDPAHRMRLTQLLQDDDDLLYARYEVLR
ncbi:MAG TPA: pyrimidine reductase family protein [Acidothermaceae bacterium]|nr:pyrimidine reductase family protein [Acidothermaceae bacterium]